MDRDDTTEVNPARADRADLVLRDLHARAESLVRAIEKARECGVDVRVGFSPGRLAGAMFFIEAGGRRTPGDG